MGFGRFYDNFVIFSQCSGKVTDNRRNAHSGGDRMGIEVRWFNEEKTLIEIVLTDPWDWPDFEQKHLDCLEMTRDSTTRPTA
jgi:hypothetical protein